MLGNPQQMNIQCPGTCGPFSVTYGLLYSRVAYNFRLRLLGFPGCCLVSSGSALHGNSPVTNLCRGPSVTNPCRGPLCTVLKSSIGCRREGSSQDPGFCYKGIQLYNETSTSTTTSEVR